MNTTQLKNRARCYELAAFVLIAFSATCCSSAFVRYSFNMATLSVALLLCLLSFLSLVAAILSFKLSININVKADEIMKREMLMSRFALVTYMLNQLRPDSELSAKFSAELDQLTAEISAYERDK